MSRRELTSSTWPLPWWVAVVPGLLFGAGVFLVVHTASSWPYVAPARLSGMVAQAVGLIAPLVCAASAWVAERFTNRHSPLAWPVLPRATGGQGLRVLGVITMSWVVLSMGLGCLAQVLVMRRATGGHFYAVELLIAALGMTFFIVSGFGFGVTIARWHAPLWGLLWGLLWVWVIPIYAQGLLPFPSKNVEYFLFPGLSASDHRSLDMGVVAAILGWWLLVPASGVLALWLWFRVAARSVHWRALLIGAVVPVVVAGCGVGVSTASES